MKQFIKDQFGIKSLEIRVLNGYGNANYLVKTRDCNYIFKTYKYDKELHDIVEAENQVLLFLDKEHETKYPTPIRFINGEFVRKLNIEGKVVACRMLSFLHGKFIGDKEATKVLYSSLAVFLAEADIELQNLTNYVLKSRQCKWDIQYLHLNKKYLPYIANSHDRNVARYFFQQFEENVSPLLPQLRKQVIHGDANEWNVLAKNGRVSGIIDFGDLAYTPLINELAIAITYACYNKENPLEWAPTLLKSYHEVLPLEEKEVDILYYLIAARLCISVCNSANSRKENPGNEYASSSEKKAWSMLHKWLEISPVYVENLFRKTVGFKINEIEKVEKKVQNRYQHISPILSLSYNKPISMNRSTFQYMYDDYGNTFLDAYNNIPHVGHSHPKVVEAGKKQMAKLNTNTRYLYDLLPAYAEKLLAKFPISLNKIYFVNSGSAATDLAIRMANAHTQHKNIMVMEHGYHGNTEVAMAISDYKFSNKKGSGQNSNILKTEIPDTYRGKYKDDDGSAGKLYAKDAIKNLKNSGSHVSAFICEPIVGCGGQVPLAKGYLKELYPAIRKQGGICISDEVQTGFGRLGDFFWGFEAQDVVPDMVIIGKPMANGHPMGAVVCTTEIAESFSKGVEFFSSFGGNPVSCAIGLSVLEVIEEENLQENAKIVGDYYKSLFVNLQSKYDCIGDVRGSGLFIGVEIVKANSFEPDKELAAYIKNELREYHILISTDGPSDSVLKTKPPLCFTKENAKHVVNTIDMVLSKVVTKSVK